MENNTEGRALPAEDPHGLPAGPGDGGTPVLESQHPDWSSAFSDKKSASKRLVKRWKRRIQHSDVVQKIRQIAHPHTRSAGSSSGASEQSETCDSSDDVQSAENSGDDELLKRLPTGRLLSDNAECFSDFTDAVTGGSADFFGRSLVIQVLMARDVPASDLNGSSDPYCVVRCGSEESSTAIVYHCLTPRWNDTFVFSPSSALDDQRKQQIHIEIKDHNKHLSDDLLGVVDVKLVDFVNGHSPKWFDIRTPEYQSSGNESEDRLGQLCLSMWLGPRAVRHSSGDIEPAPVVSTLTAPVNSCRMLPTVVHSGPHCMYEEPTHVYLKVGLHKVVVDDAEQLRAAQQLEANDARNDHNRDWAAEQLMASCPENDQLRPEDRSDNLNRMERPSAAHPTLYAEREASESEQTLAPDSADEPPSEDEQCHGMSGENINLDIKDPFRDDNDDGDDENRKLSNDGKEQTSCSSDGERNTAAALNQTWLFLKVTLADQTRKTKLQLLIGDSIRFRTSFIFPVTAPLRQQEVQLRLFRASASKAHGRLVATAVIPLVDLINRSTDLAVPGVSASEASRKDRRWFQLHSVRHGRHPAMAQAQLSFAACDADLRRQLYRQPLLDLQEPSTEGTRCSSLVSARDGFSILEDMRRRRQQMSFDQQTPCVTAEPLGVLSVTLHGVDLADKVHSFCVVTCGPHWGLTCITPDCDSPRFNWQMHIPLHDPYTLFQLGVFKSGKPGEIKAIKRHIPFVKDKPLLLGKLRVRLTTMLPGRSYRVAMPMLAGRRNGGARTSTAHLTMQVKYRSTEVMLGSYFEPQLPQGAYNWGIAQGANDKTINNHQRKMVHDWLEAQQPSLPTSVTMVMADNARDEFSLPRAQINFRRCREALNDLSRFKALITKAKTWQNPPLSIGVIFAAWLMCYQITSFAVLMVGGLLVHQLRRQDPRKEYPLPMDDDPTGLKADGKDKDDGRNSREKHLSFKIRARHKYDHLLDVGLRMQNAFEDFAALFERIQAAFDWKDPIASSMVLEGTVLFGVIVIWLGFPTTIFLCICVMLRHPVLRTPTIPLPMRFYLRLPTRSDEIM